MVYSPKYFFDENLLPVGKALEVVRGDVAYPGCRNFPEIPIGAKDTDWLPIVGNKGLDLVTFTQDKGIQRKPAELQAFLEHGVRLIVLAPKRDLSKLDKLVLIVRWWDKTEALVRKQLKGPCRISLTDSGPKMQK